MVESTVTSVKLIQSFPGITVQCNLFFHSVKNNFYVFDLF
jgi:hypothetical protein